jgi:hypothetical protein
VQLRNDFFQFRLNIRVQTPRGRRFDAMNLCLASFVSLMDTLRTAVATQNEQLLLSLAE